MTMMEPAPKRRKVKGQSSRDRKEEPTISDPRFANIQSDPRFRLPRKKNNVKLDKRFSRILQDDEFTRKAKVDRYGRRIDADNERERLKRRYEFEEEDNDAKDEPDNDDDIQHELRRIETSFDPLRDGRDSQSSTDESSSDEDDLEEEPEAVFQQQDDQIPTGDVTSRIAVVNVDWDNIRAADLMAVFSSFLPATGRLLHAAIYPSEFGKERMEREEMEGPPPEIFKPLKQAEEEDDKQDIEIDEQEEEEDIKKSILTPDQGEEFNSAKLRQYQLERLRYFYAILTFSSPDAAKAVYDAADGAEYLSTANFFDLRFVPEEISFSSDTPREECEKIPEGYKPNEFVTDALQHSKVKLSWDAEDNSRKEVQARAFRGGRAEIDENDIKAYLGTDSSDNEDADAIGEADLAATKKEIERQKMRALLGLDSEPMKRSKKEDGPVGGVQITFSSGLSGQDGMRGSVFENEPEVEETTVEKYVRKERERKQKRKERLKNANDDAAQLAQVDLESKRGNEESEAPNAGFDDPFFADPVEDKAAASKMRKQERLKKKAEREAEEATAAAGREELELLMVDDKDTGLRHFNMKEIERAEKRQKKKGKKNKKTALDEMITDNFKMDTHDPRFSRLFDNHEFAIDPTNPRFKGTEGMKALLEEGRKRRKEKVGGAEDDVPRQVPTSREKVDTDVDVSQLVNKLKKRKSS